VSELDCGGSSIFLGRLKVQWHTLSYRAELNVKLPGLDTMTPDDVKKSIETVVADPAAVSAVQSKTVKLGMSPDEVKQSLGNPDKIVDLGAKQVFIYKDMKVILIDGKVSDVQ